MSLKIENKIQPSHIANPGKLHQTMWKVAQANDPEKEITIESVKPVNPKAFDIHPVGHRMLVVLDPVPETYGRLQLPEEYQSREKMGAGIIMSVGSLVGSGVPFPGSPLGDSSEFLYKHIVFGMHSGNVLRLDVMDREYHSGIIVLTDRDIWAIDNYETFFWGSPNPEENLDDNSKA